MLNGYRCITAFSGPTQDEYRSNTGIPQCTTPIFPSYNISLQWSTELATADSDHEMDEVEKYLQACISY